MILIKYNDSQQYNIQINMTQYLQSLSSNPFNNNPSSNQFSQSLRVVDNPEAVLQELFLSSQDSDKLNKFFNDPAYSYSPYHYNQRAQLSQDNKLNMKLNNERLQLKELEERMVRKLQVTEDILSESKQIIENQRMINKLLRKLSQQSSITQNLMQERSNNLNTITYYQKIWHHYNQQCTLLDQSTQLTNNVPTNSYNSTRHIEDKVEKILVGNILHAKNNRQQAKQTKQTQHTKQKRKTQQSVCKEEMKKPSQRIEQSIRIYKNSQNKQSKGLNKFKNESVLNFSLNSNCREGRNNISVKAHSKNKQNEYMSINSIEEQLKAVKEINKSYKSPSPFDKSHNYVSIKNFASIDKSLSTDESIDQLFGNIELAQRASTPYGRAENKSKMYKKVAPHAPWGQRNRGTAKPCSGRKGEQKLSNIYQEYKYKLYNKGVDPSQNEFLQISYPNRSYNIEKNNSKNQMNKCRMRNSSIFSNNKLTEYTPQIQVDKSSGRNKIMTVKIDVRGCK